MLVRTILRRSTEPELRAAHLLEAANLGEAREYLARDAVDVMLVDVQLPDGSGLGLVEELTGSVPVAERPRIIALTGDVSTSRRAEAMAVGCDAFLDKPYTAGELRDLVSKHLTR